MKALIHLMSKQYEQQLLFNPLGESYLSDFDLVQSDQTFSSVELFAGAGGLALGLEKAGFESVLFNEIDTDACQTLRQNRPHWNVVEDDVSQLSFEAYHHKVDLLSGGFPCQAFSYAGKKLGFEDIRGTLFFQFARAVKEIQPRVFLGENVRGLLRHEQGKTLETMTTILKDLGYILIEPKVLNASFYRVPQKRERLFLIGIRKDLYEGQSFLWPEPSQDPSILKDALKAGELYPTDVPFSKGQKYPIKKEEVLKLVPPGGYWRNLPDDIQRDYMKKSYFMGGGKTGIARRLSWHEPSLTLTCAPSQNQTERCHPDETRPLTIREYARIQTFPDEWEFYGSLSSQYKQIGNAVPVNLGYAMGKSLIHLLNSLTDHEE
jgi:DNA (cytosine-5)-methyltransferase 1